MEVEYIRLSRNRINSIADNTFENLKKLKTLWLQENNLETLSAGTFLGLESLTSLRLDGNQLMMLPADVFSHLPRPLKFGLFNLDHNRTTDNPLICDAGLCWLKQEELEGNIDWPNVFVCLHTCNFYRYSPRCTDGIDWDVWSCDDREGLSLTLAYLY